MQWIARTPSSSSSDSTHQQRQQQKRLQWPQVSLGLLQLLLPLQRPAGGPMLLQVNLQQQLLHPLQQLLALRVTPQATPPPSPATLAAAGSNSSSSSCWQPVVVYSSIWGRQQHSLVLNTTLAAAAAAASDARGWIGWGSSILAPWVAAAGPKVSKLSGSAAAVYTQLQLSQVSAGSSSGSSSSTLLLLLDPSCGYTVSLGWDIVGAGALLLLRHGSTAAGIAVALLLLVLSHQMSSLVRVMSVARHGTAATHSGSTNAAAAAAAAGGGGSSMTSPSTRSSSPSQLQRQYSQRQQQLFSSSRRRTPSPTSAAADGQDGGGGGGGGGGGFIPSLPSPAASVARRLVRTVSSEYSDGGYNMLHDHYNNDSDSEGAALPLLGIQQQQQQRQQPSVAGPHSFLNLSFSGGLTGGGITLEQSAPGASDAEWGLGEDDSVCVLNPKPQTTVSAMQRFRRQITITLGGVPPPVEQQIAAAAAAAAGGGDADSSSGSNSRVAEAGRDSSIRGQQGLRTIWAGRFRAAAFPWASASSSSSGMRAVPNNSSSSDSRQQQQQQQRKLQAHRVHGGWSGVGISVLGSLVAVTGDLRVLLLAGFLSAAAAGLNTLNPDSIWNSSSSSRGVTHTRYNSGSSSSSGGAYWVLQQLLSVVGLAQRGDSPGVVGCGVLLGLALLVLLVAVAVSWALKWLLDYVTAAVGAFNRWA
jgi:hypothetical protein